MAFTEADLEDLFTYHAPDPVQMGQLTLVREAALRFARVITQNSPASPDQSTAIRKLRECVMTVNASIIFRGKH